MKRLLAPPVFEDDEDKTRVAGLLNTILPAAIAGTVLLIVATPIVTSDPVTPWAFESILALLELSTLFLMRRGDVQLASALFTFGAWAYLTLVTVAFGGMRGPNTISYISVVLIAGLLGGRRAGVGFAGLSALAGLGMLYAEMGGVLPPPAAPLVPIGWWLTLVVNLIMVTALQHFATRSIHEALERARREIAERKLAEEVEREQRALAEALRDIAAALNSTLQLDEVLDLILANVGRVVPHDAVNITLVDAERDVAQIARSRGYAEHGPEALVPSLLFRVADVANLRQMAETRQPLVIPDTQTYPGWIDVPEAHWVRSYASTPISVKSQIVGFLNLDSATPGFFTSAHAERLQAFADQAAIAVHNARLHEQIQRQADELEQRVAERTHELAEAVERLRELDRLKSRFVSDVSHELRTPATNISLYVSLLERGKPGKRSDYLAVLKDQTERLKSLIAGILKISELDLEKDRASFGQVNLNVVVEPIITSHRPRAEAAGLNLTFDADEHVPAVRGNIDLLAQAVTHLLVNALTYTTTGQVRVSTRRMEKHACFEVQDTGGGIEPEDLPHIFERFYRGGGVSTIPGNGLGLAIVKEIVDRHGGRIEVESEVGVGSTFRVWLPTGQTQT